MYYPHYWNAASREYTREAQHSPSISMEAIRREARLIAIEDNVHLDFLRQQLELERDFQLRAKLRAEIIKIHREYLYR